MKKVYIQPKTEVFTTALDTFMLDASPAGSKVYGTSASSTKDVLSKDRGDYEPEEPTYGDLW
ncbi:MAG: hypothetical protein IJV06_05095 [Bacteroidaceae bacterium]|nr:hypothetical protein [Bacteroidaceae bacterium]